MTDSARAMYQRATEADSSNVLAYFTLGQSLLRTGRDVRAREVLQQLQRRAPDDKWTLLFGVQLQETLERQHGTVPAYRKVLQRFPEDPDVILPLAKAELTAGTRGDETLILTGLRRLEELQRRDSSDYTQEVVSFQLAWAYQIVPQIRDLSKAERLYERALSYNPRNVTALNNLIAIAAAYADFDRVSALSRRVLEIQPGEPVALENLAYGYHLKGDFKEAVTWYDSAAKVSLTPASVYALRGEALLWLGRTAEAHRDFAAARSSLTNRSGEADFIWTRVLLGRYDRSGKSRMIYYGTLAQKHASIDLLDGAAYARENEQSSALKALRAAVARLHRADANDVEVVRMGFADLARLRGEARTASAVRPGSRVPHRLAHSYTVEPGGAIRRR
jgi:tetratricopeptide (TPR) repeat protein